MQTDIGEPVPDSVADRTGIRSARSTGPQALRIGRRAPCDVILSDDEVTSAHCEVRAAGGDVSVTDLLSTNRTFSDGRRVRGTARLRHGGVLEVGRKRLRLEMREVGDLERSDGMDRDLECVGQ